MLNIKIAAEPIFQIFGIAVTNSLFTSWMVMIVLLIIAVLVYKKINIMPRSGQLLFEFFIEQLLNITEGMFGSRKDAEKYLPIVATIFLFVLLSNWLGVFPGMGSIGFNQVHEGVKEFVPLFRPGSSDLNFTLALAITTIVLVNVFGILSIGIAKHISKFFTVKSAMDFFVGLLEFISEIAKMISFSFRLFGNVFAGEVLLVLAAVFMPYLFPVPLLAFEVFVGFIQASVFAMLAAVFIAMAVKHESH